MSVNPNSLHRGRPKVDTEASHKLWSRSYVFLIIANFFLFFGDNLLLPVLPVYVKKFGANDFQIGIVAGIFFATSILVRMFTSRMAAKTGRKTLLIIAMVVCCVAMLGYYFSAGLLLIILWRLIQGGGFGASTTLYGASVADMIPLKRMGEGMGIFGLGLTIAGALGPFLGAASVASSDFRWVFLVAGALVLVSIILTIFSSTENHQTEQPKRQNLKDFLSDFVEPRAIYPALYMLLIGLAMGGFFTYIVLYGEEIKVSQISLFFIVAAVSEFLIRVVCGKLYDRHGMTIVVVPGALAGILACVVLAKANSLAMIIIASLLVGLAFGTIFPVADAIAMKSVSPERRVAANATVYNFLDIGMGLGPLLFGAVAQLSGYSQAFLISGAIFVIMLALAVLSRIFKWRTKDGLPHAEHY